MIYHARMRYIVTGTDQETGQPIELTVEAADVPAAAAMGAKKGVTVSGVRAVTQAAPPLMPPMPPPRQAPPVMPTRTPVVPSAPPTPKKKVVRIWLSLVLLIAAILAPVIPGVPLWAGIVVLALVGLYMLPPLRRGVGGFLRVSPDRPVWRVFKLTAFVLIGASLIGLSFAGRQVAEAVKAAEAEREAAVLAKAQADAEASAKVAGLVDDAKKSLDAGDLTKAGSLLDIALSGSAPNRGLAESLRTSIRNSADAEWVAATLVSASDEEFARFRDGGSPPKALDFGHAVLTDRAVALARPQIGVTAGKREEVKRQAEAAAEAARRVAEEKAAADRGEVTVTREEYGDAWPFTVDSGVLKGVPTGQRTAGGTDLVEVTFTSGGTTYALNGIARDTRKYAEIDGIWASDPNIVGLKKNVGPIIDRGLALVKSRPAAEVSPAAPEKLDASVSFSGTQFTITNKNSYDWNGVKLEINGGIVSRGYVLRMDRLAAGQTYKVGAAQFTKSDGERFNPLTHKVKQLLIFCKEGDFIGGWK
jgi:hypothetical protein